MNPRPRPEKPRPGDPNAPRRAGLDPQPMVDWLSPTELARAGVKAVLAATFGNYADRREVQAALSPGPAVVAGDYSGADELWFDYAADIGDGFNPTYAVAWLLARPQLTVPPPPKPSTESRPWTLPAGSFIVLGGDQIYPTPKREEYRVRLIEPLKTAFNTGRPKEAARETDLFVIPGNHDWYDGLTSFVRLFCQRRTLGQLRTRQQRSYFALKLPHDWWLWGIDIQLEADIDEPQKQFFHQVAESMVRSDGGKPRLILCTGQPSWVRCGIGTGRTDLRPRPEAFETLGYFEELIQSCGIHLAATIAGDLHHIAHYAPESAKQPHRITAGGGGAYLYPTHHLPHLLQVPVGRPDPLRSVKRERDEPYRLAAVYPPPDESRRLGWGVLNLPFRNKTFALFIGVLYVLLAWILQSASKSPASAFAGLLPGLGSSDGLPSLMMVLRNLGPGDVPQAWQAFWGVMRHSPSSVIFALGVIWGLLEYRASDYPRYRFWGALHGVFHVLLCMLLIWVFSVLNLRVLELPIETVRQVALFLVEMLLVGSIAGAFLFALYLLASAWLSGVHINEVYSSQAIQDWKSFLRLHITRDGALEIFPIAIPTVPRENQWQSSGLEVLSPAGGDIAIHQATGVPIRIEV